MPKTKLVVSTKSKKRMRKEVEAPVVSKRGRGRPRKEVVESIKRGLDDALKFAKGDKKAGRVANITVPVKTAKGLKSAQKIKSGKEAPVTDHRKGPRINNTQLLLKDAESKRVTQPATRVLEQLTNILGRAEVQQFRGRKERPQLVLTMLESEALQECKILFETKLSMQREGQLRQRRN